MKIDTGGPAFARTAIPDSIDPCRQLEGGSEGMSLRDYFAGQALAGLAAAPDSWKHQDIPEMAFKLADGMIAEKRRTEASATGAKK